MCKWVFAVIINISSMIPLGGWIVWCGGRLDMSDGNVSDCSKGCPEAVSCDTLRSATY